jgi:hypothetical protein
MKNLSPKQKVSSKKMLYQDQEPIHTLTLTSIKRASVKNQQKLVLIRNHQDFLISSRSHSLSLKLWLTYCKLRKKREEKKSLNSRRAKNILFHLTLNLQEPSKVTRFWKIKVQGLMITVLDSAYKIYYIDWIRTNKKNPKALQRKFWFKRTTI